METIRLDVQNGSFFIVSSYRKYKRDQIFIRMAGQTSRCLFNCNKEVSCYLVARNSVLFSNFFRLCGIIRLAIRRLWRTIAPGSGSWLVACAKTRRKTRMINSAMAKYPHEGQPMSGHEGEGILKRRRLMPLNKAILAGTAISLFLSISLLSVWLRRGMPRPPPPPALPMLPVNLSPHKLINFPL